MKHRVTARGLLREKDQVLLVDFDVEGRQFACLPGGAQELGESLEACLLREFLEETNLRVELGPLLLINEFIHSKHFSEDWKGGIHQVEAIFLVKALEPLEHIQEGSQPDPGSTGLKWYSCDDFVNKKIYPELGVDWFFADHSTHNPGKVLYHKIIE